VLKACAEHWRRRRNQRRPAPPGPGWRWHQCALELAAFFRSIPMRTTRLRWATCSGAWPSRARRRAGGTGAELPEVKEWRGILKRGDDGKSPLGRSRDQWYIIFMSTMAGSQNRSTRPGRFNPGILGGTPVFAAPGCRCRRFSTISPTAFHWIISGDFDGVYPRTGKSGITLRVRANRSGIGRRENPSGCLYAGAGSPSTGGHEVTTAAKMGWGELENGALLAAAEGAGLICSSSATKTCAINKTLR